MVPKLRGISTLIAAELIRARARAREAGMVVVMDLCILKEHQRLPG